MLQGGNSVLIIVNNIIVNSSGAHIVKEEMLYILTMCLLLEIQVSSRIHYSSTLNFVMLYITM